MFSDDEFDEFKPYGGIESSKIVLNDSIIQFDTMVMPSSLPNEQYHLIEAISASGLKKAWSDPKLYLNKDALMRMPSPALDVGTALHEALLEPDKYDIENYNLTKLNKEKLGVMNNNGKVMFDYILKDTLNEVSFFHQDNEFIRKVRVDAYDQNEGIIYDVKSSRYNNKRKFINDAYELGYHIQAAFYIDTLRLCGFNVEAFAFLVVPSESPCEPFAVQITDDFIEDGRGQYSELIQEVLEYKQANSNRVKFHLMDLPQWRRDQIGLS